MEPNQINFNDSKRAASKGDVLKKMLSPENWHQNRSISKIPNKQLLKTNIVIKEAESQTLTLYQEPPKVQNEQHPKYCAFKTED